MTLDNSALLLLRQRVKYRTQLLTSLPEDGFPPVVWTRIPRGTCSPILNGIDFDEFQTFNPLLVGHQATWRGLYSRNGQTFSSLTGRTSGLPLQLGLAL